MELLIIMHSQDVCSKNSTDNASPLHLASRNGHVKTAVKLIERRADARAENDRWEIPLHLVIQWGYVDVGRMLNECGADLSAQVDYGTSSLHLESQRGKSDVARMLC